MTTSGTYGFNPSAADAVLNAFSMIQVRRWELTDQHLEDAAYAFGMLMVEFSNRNPNIWASEDVAIPLFAGVPTYSLPDRTVSIACGRISQIVGGVVTDRLMGPLAMTDYDALPVKLQVGAPTTYTFRLLTPTPNVSIWPITPADGLYTAVFSIFRQMQDVTLANGVTIDSPFRFLDAITKGLAARLCVYYPPSDPDKATKLDTQFKEAFNLAAQQEQESTPMFIRPQFNGYFR